MSRTKSVCFGRTPRRRIYLLNPKNPDSFWSMRETVQAVGVKTLMPSAALATLVGLTPPDRGIEYVYCDENIAPVEWNTPCDLVAITGYTLHADRIAELARVFRARGIPVALGGAFATLNPERAREHADHLFIGEAEVTWPRFLQQWLEGEPEPLYAQTTPVDLADSCPPNRSLIDGKDYLYLTVQTSRGCPNRCDFCDAIRLVGRRVRTKSVDRIMTEIEDARRAGAETIFFSEDNFYADKAHTKRLLERIVEWNTSLQRPVQFACQASIRIADDEEIIRLLADARVAVVFLGVESVRRECLAEVNKGRLFRPDLKQRIRRLSGYGILPFIGMMVGFDNDDEQTFAELEALLDETGSPIASISVLNAPEDTVLYRRMQRQGRINEHFSGVWHFSTNIVPRKWPLEMLLAEHRNLFQRIYEPKSFEPRMLKWLSNVHYFPDLYRNKRRGISDVRKIVRIVKYYALRAPRPVRAMFFRVLKKTWAIDPRLVRKAITIMTQYCHYYSFVNDPAWRSADRSANGLRSRLEASAARRD